MTEAVLLFVGERSGERTMNFLVFFLAGAHASIAVPRASMVLDYFVIILERDCLGSIYW